MAKYGKNGLGYHRNEVLAPRKDRDEDDEWDISE